MGKKIRIALSGYGRYGRWHTRELNWMPKLRGRTEIVGIYDPKLITIKRLPIKGASIADSFENLLNIDELDAVIVASPPSEHSKQVVQALNSGLHVYSEVPMALNYEDIEKIIDAEASSGKCYQFGENYAFLPQILYGSQLINPKYKENNKMNKNDQIVAAEMEFMIDESHKWWTIDYVEKSDQPKIHPYHKIDWFNQFDPIMYGHSIGPCQVLMGSIEQPEPFVEVKSYGNSIGDSIENPAFKDSFTYHQAIFKTKSGSIAKCTNAYVLPHKGSKISFRLISRDFFYETSSPNYNAVLSQWDKHSNLIRKKKINRFIRRKSVPWVIGDRHGANTRILDNWLSAIENHELPCLNAKIAANMCASGIAASEAARSNKSVEIKTYRN